MDDISAIVFDLDGTLLDDVGNISRKEIECIKDLKKTRIKNIHCDRER